MRPSRVLGGMAVLVCCGLGAARDLGAQATEAENGLTLRPMFYFSNTDGTSFIGPAGLRIIMEDSVLVTNWAAQLEWRRGAAVLWIEGASSTASDVAELDPGSAPLPYDITLRTVELFGGYRFGTDRGAAELLALAGVRHYHLNQGLGGQDLVKDTWVTPVVGVQGRARTSRASAWVRADGAARLGRPTVVWELRVGLDWQVLGVAGLGVQYRFLALEQRFSPDKDLAFDGTSQGWVVGLLLKL